MSSYLSKYNLHSGNRDNFALPLTRKESETTYIVKISTCCRGMVLLPQEEALFVIKPY